MPRRKLYFETGSFYHIFNRSIYHQPILEKERDIITFLRLMEYYSQTKPPVRFSYYRNNSNKYLIDLSNRLVTVISYCLMPTHFHLTLKQEKENGIQIYLRKMLNSYSHYFNKKYRYSGTLFEGTFKAVEVKTDEQLIHLSRYHHLNPVTSHIVNHPKDYKYSSYMVYMGEKSKIVDPSYVLSHFSSVKAYEKFVLDRKEYQRELEMIKHLLFG